MLHNVKNIEKSLFKQVLEFGFEPITTLCLLNCQNRSTLMYNVQERNFYLGLLDGGVEPVAHGRDVEARQALPVPLLEELLHDALHPAAVQLQRLRGVRQVGAVNHVLQHLLTIQRQVS